MITEEQIWNYLDGALDDAATEEIMRAISSDNHIADLFQEISALHQSLEAHTLLSPSAQFTDRVMSSVNVAPPVKQSIWPWVIFLVPIISTLAACAAWLVYNHLNFSYTLPSFTLHSPDRFTSWFIIADIIILIYFADELSEYRFNRKALFSK
jgi:hypothetical protein